MLPWLWMLLIVAACGVAAVLIVTYVPPRLLRLLRVRRLRRQFRGKLALTYDDGPDDTLTPALLDLLERHGARATFFLVGFRAERDPDVCDRLVAAGHETGCHTRWHRTLRGPLPWADAREVEDGFQSLARWLPNDAPFRPPYGALTTWAWLALRRRESAPVWWTSVSGDTLPKLPDPSAVAHAIFRRRGGVILLHCHHRSPDRRQFVLALTEQLLVGAREHGLEVCTLSEGARRPTTALQATTPLPARRKHTQMSTDTTQSAATASDGQQKELASEVVLRLRCPRSGQPIVLTDGEARSADGAHVYPFLRGILDLRCCPATLHIQRPWFEPWDEIDDFEPEFPTPLDAPDLPFHLDRYQARFVGTTGQGRWVLEIGCAGRHTEPFFRARGYTYVGIDIDIRGAGPDVLADAHNLPLREQSFDLCYAMSVLEHLVSPLTAALEIHRVLRPGGAFLGSAAFVYGFHDRASFFHMTHAGLLCTLRTAGFEQVRIWPGWPYSQSIPQMAFGDRPGTPWRVLSRWCLGSQEWTYTRLSNFLRLLFSRRRLNPVERWTQTAGGLNFFARKPE